MSAGTRIDVGKILRMAYRLAGIRNEFDALSPEEVSEGTELLETIVDHLPAHGIFASDTKLYTVTLTSGTADYPISDSASILMVVGDAMLAPSSYTGSTGETPVVQVGAQRWHERGILGESGVPSQFWLNRGVSPAQVSFAPIPDEAYSVRFRARRLLTDVASTTAAPDLDRPWALYLVQQLAAMLKDSKHGPEMAASKYRQAERTLERCKGFSNETTPSQMEVEITLPEY